MSASRLLAGALMLGCGGSNSSVNHVEDPQPQAGGGLGAGEIVGELNVFVVDDASGGAIPGAEVRVEGADVAEPLVATTDALGWALIKDGSLEGPQVVTASAKGYAVSTWFGVNGAVVTIPLETADPGEATDSPPTAMASGTILGWEDIPDPDPGFALAAMVTFSHTDDASESNITQDPHPTLSALLPNLPANTCVRFRLASPPLNVDTCDPLALPAAPFWSLRTRTGEQTLYAVIVLLDINALATGTVGPGDFQIVGYASLAGLSPEEDDELLGADLEMFPENNLVDSTISAGDLPSGLDRMVRGAIIDLGQPGRVLLPPDELTALFPALDIDAALLPEATGDFEGAYTFHATALEDGTTEYPVSRLVDRDAEPGEVDLGDWLPQPADLTGDPATRIYSFTRAAGASVHDVSIDDTDGTRAWNVVLLEPPLAETPDGGAPGDTIAFTLPALPQDPLPTGNLHMTARATDIPGFDPLGFSDLSAALRQAGRQSEDRLRISQ